MRYVFFKNRQESDLEHTQPAETGRESLKCTVRISIVDMVVLRVRTRRAGDSPQPEFLYQIFPPDALPLVATLPRGTFPVSIPYYSNSGCGYIITKSMPTGKKGFVLVYELKPSRNYEAVNAIFQGREYGMEEFVAYASRWTGHNAGTLHRVPGKFLYFAPTRDQWNVIRRDHGYMAVDPAIFGAGLSADVLQKRERVTASGVIARVPLLACEVKGTRLVPYFRKVELTFDGRPNPQTRWNSFREYLRIKARESLPPDGITGNFPAWLEELKNDSRFESWVFRAGRLFGARTEWWGDQNRRYAEHEGIDFAEGRDADGLIRPIPEGTPVRALEHGEIAVILDDFLGKTILVRHPQTVNQQESVLYTQYSHILPAGISASGVAKGQILGRVGRLTKSTVPAHFHFAAAWIPRALPPASLTLSHLHPGYVPVTLIDFNTLIE
jgi:hypothetical protein